MDVDKKASRYTIPEIGGILYDLDVDLAFELDSSYRRNKNSKKNNNNSIGH